ncbi:hypothetical protein H2201_007373 [Coniosporium apollinis]|uniref:T6SS Phospholipase effector Tle1-like catalytic domain-containing protein n=2 Tax=Coniosporium TaxID=2810619 RepID=A0ABQ9NJ82_9PEZI|nr:hypothetical protein H2199_006083 [Cladosporium sp. JES 115]KAJ9659482.1 hypothetical protein H2201_007373 [Coniosporium apollinis]
MIGINPTAADPTYTSPTGDVHAKYFHGVGLGGDFMSYLWDGAFATHAERDCTKVYDYIVQNFAPGHEVWMFGLSRGAYIVRSVAGMINNCGIISNSGNAALIGQVYRLYRSPYAVHEPSSVEMQRFRNIASHPVVTPIKFMGIFDTVGSRGIPQLNYDTGVGFVWPEFHDNLVSSAVEKVYHAVATHDRLWAFQPCLASRDTVKHAHRHDLKIYQKWFPGAHYDLARQEFQFLREGRRGLEGIASSIINRLSRTISPNDQLADLVLLWMLDSIRTERGGAIIRQNTAGRASNIDVIISGLQASLPHGRIGTGDMYANIFRYLPLWNLLSIPLSVVWLVNASLYQILLNPQDRVIPDPGNPMSPLVQNEVYDYTIADPNHGNSIIGNTARVGTLPQQDPRYPSRTFQNYATYMVATGRIP